MGIGLAVGAAVGIALGRKNRVRWDQATGSVVSQMDMVGVVLLLVYLAFSFSRGRIAAEWIDDAHAAAGVALALGVGSIAGRILYLLLGSVTRWRLPGCV